MSNFLQALDLYRSRMMSSEELQREVARQLDAGSADVNLLLAQLHVEHAQNHLPSVLYAELTQIVMRSRAVANSSDNAGPSPAQSADADSSETATAVDPTRPLVATPAPVPRRTSAIGVGTILQRRFRLIEPIGEGGMSIVYNAIDLRKVEARAPDTHVAVKILAVPASEFAHSLEVLQAEAHALQRLPHPNIVRVIDCDRDGRTVFMTMEYLTGESLKRRMIARDFRPLPVRDAIPIIESVASGLAFAHRNGIVHGDLKPGNVHITADGTVKIIDFGIARLLTRDPGATLAGDERPKLSALTPPYASPEMLEGGSPDPRDDIYALACIAHELLTGHHPFDRIVANEARDSGVRLSRAGSLSPAHFKAIAHGLEFDREKRTATADEFLREFQASSGLRARTGATIVAILLAVGLALTYLLGHDRLHQWFRSIGTARPASPVPGQLFRDCPTCPLMKVLPPGRFNQGASADSSKSTPFERPRHAVVIGYPMGISIYEVTVGEYKEFADAMPKPPSGCMTYDGAWTLHPELGWSSVGFQQTAAHPVVCVSWQDAEDYTAWLSKKTGHTYRLPSDSEWEYAARAGSDLATPWGESAAACANANVADQTAARRYPGWKVEPCSDGYVYTAPVGSFNPNAFGLFDMLGNAFEWVQDCWHADYAGAPTDGSAWMSGGCAEHGLRGGSWFSTPYFVSTSARSRFEPDYRSNSVGFRLVREISP